MRNLMKTVAVAVSIAAIMASTAVADPKPKGAKGADPQMIANFHAGKTHNWKDCKGGIYYGANWQAQAWCHKEGKAVGIGTWSVNKRGRICHDLTWYWKKGDGVGSNHKPVTDRECTDHIVDEIGTVWRSWGGENDWWPLASNKNLVKGFKHKSKISRLRNQLGV